MTFVTALTVLKAKLIFGDPLQICAVRLLEDIEECAAAIKACPHDIRPCERCKGAGYIDCECLECGHRHDRDCPECDGDDTGGPCPECTRAYPSKIVFAAIEWVKDSEAGPHDVGICFGFDLRLAWHGEARSG